MIQEDVLSSVQGLQLKRNLKIDDFPTTLSYTRNTKIDGDKWQLGLYCGTHSDFIEEIPAYSVIDLIEILYNIIEVTDEQPDKGRFIIEFNDVEAYWTVCYISSDGKVLFYECDTTIINTVHDVLYNYYLYDKFVINPHYREHVERKEKNVLLIEREKTSPKEVTIDIDNSIEFSDLEDDIKEPNKENVEDKVNHPSHYTWLKDKCGIEVLDITRHLNFNRGNALKYILRAGHKTEEGMDISDKTIEDLEKAIFYLQDEINRLKGQI